MPARSNGDSEAHPRRRELHDVERSNPARRTPRRRRQGAAPWLQRNALSIAAVCLLLALLGLGFGLLQLITRTEPSQAVVAVSDTDRSPTVVGTTVALPAAQPAPSADIKREIQASARVIDPNYTVASGDTLAGIANRFGTTVERIQAFNNLPDPRALRIGTRLVIPPAL